MADNKVPDNRPININEGNYNEHIYGDYVEGNYYNVSFNFRRQNKNYTQIRQKLLQIVNERIESIINSSLNNRVYMVLEMEQDPEQIEAPFLGEVKVNFQRKITLDNTEIINVFDHPEVAGRLLILGQPGAGKTTMLYKLAFELVKRASANSNHPIPVILSLSSWKNDNQSIKDWLVNELKDKYGVRKDIGKGLVENQEIIPLLDGLDELAAERQENCVIKINEFLQPSTWTNPVVVCSRLKEYERYKALLQLNNSIELRPLSTEQIYQYLRSTDNLQLWNSISHDADLSQLAQTPLLLNIIVLSAEELLIQTWQQFKSSDKRLGYLFDAYISRMLKRPYKDKQPLQSNTERWLSWLSRRLIEESATEFFIEKIQPDWLSNKFHKIIYDVIVWGVIGTLINGLIYGRILGLTSGLIEGLIYGLISGLIYGLIGELIKKKIESIKLINRLINFRMTIKWLIYGLINGLNYGLINGLINGLIHGLRSSGLSSGLINGLISGLISGLILGLIRDEIQPVENLKFSLDKSLTGLILGLISGLILELIVTLINGATSLLINSLIPGLINGLIYGLILAMVFGFDGIELENKTVPNQGINQSVINTIIISTVTCLLASLLIFVIQKFTQPNVHLNQALIYSLTSGLCTGLLIGIPKSGTPAIKHFVLRAILWSNGYIPWNYAKFLNYSTNRLFLQRVGGGYRFVHDLLRQHFANSYTQRSLAPVQEIPVEISPIVQNHIVCTNCSHNNLANNKFCTKCGTPLIKPHT
jgi:GTPase SAR1 family protein